MNDANTINTMFFLNRLCQLGNKELSISSKAIVKLYKTHRILEIPQSKKKSI